MMGVAGGAVAQNPYDLDEGDMAEVGLAEGVG